MVFSSLTFIYYFLPIVLLFYFIMPSKYKNLILLLFSLIFYFYGEQGYVLLLIMSCLLNYIFGIIIEKYRHKRVSKNLLFLCIILNLSILFYFKYTNFFIKNINFVFNKDFNLLNIVLPIGISFFTFQTISYVIDIYNKKIKPAKNFIDFSCYVCLFPQLVAGPIVRYSEIDKELKNRKFSFDDFGYGVKRFVIGLFKKVVIANSIGLLITSLYSVNMSVISYIVIALSYALQIYFDFSGYSDMAIGLGRMFGFHFPENFNYPFIASSITDFWKRWHMSLSRFFKDYVYIPLGGDRKGFKIHIRNIFIVWFLTGLWHGAEWNFIIWGLYFAFFLVLEKYVLKDLLKKHKIFSHIYTFIIVIISFVIFNINDFNQILVFLKSMIGLNNIPFINSKTIYYLKSYFILLIISFLFSTPLIKYIYTKYKNKKIVDFVEVIIICILLIVSTSFLIDSSFNPFLYFRF